jgi:dTDP-4-dehydrorhamnose reductase
MRVMVTGAAGLLGAAIAREFADASPLTLLDRAGLDLTDAAAVASVTARVSPDVVINCAAFNDVDGAETQAVQALEVNAFAVLALSRASQEAGARLVHYSTDFVFDGTGDRPYTEEDTPSPRSMYGAAKLLGDWFALEQPSSYVLRVESLFGHPGPSGGRKGSLGTILDQIRAGSEVPVFTDRTVSPTYTTHIARATRALLTANAAPGLYHCVNDGHATWDRIAAEAARLLDRPIRMRPLTMSEARLKAARPRYCALSNAKLSRAGVRMPHWRDALREYIAG